MSESIKLHNLWLCIEEMRKIEEEMPAQRTSIFLLIAQRKGITYKELMNITGLANSTISRNIGQLADMNRRGQPGHQLVEAVPDPVEPRRKTIHLTPKGKRVVRTLLTHLSADKGGVE